MRFLFVLNRLAHVRHFDRVVRQLAERGHDVCLASQDDEVDMGGVIAAHPRITAVAGPRNRTDEWATHATALRRARDYIRYLHPRYAVARQLRSRAFEKLAAALSDRSDSMDPAFSELLLGLTKPEQKHLDATLAKFETVIPCDPAIDAFIADARADALLLSPMVGVGFSQADFVKSAKRLGIPTAMLVFSWDNLSSKGLIHEMPDRMLVWNHIQRQEAVKLHRYPADCVVITGAPRFDAFFEMKPATTREELCGLAGLDPGRQIVTYLCSSKFVAALERDFVQRWIGEIRRSVHPALREANLLVRLHPAGTKGWHESTAADVRWPTPEREKATVSRPLGDARTVVMSSAMQNADQVLYDTIHHSAAIVGLNTSAEIEAAIVGRPVYTILDAAAKGQQGSLHFHYLLRPQGGHVTLAEDFDQHCTQLAEALAGRYDGDAIRSFLRGFVRPHGIETAVSPLVAHALEELPAIGRRSPDASAQLALNKP